MHAIPAVVACTMIKPTHIIAFVSILTITLAHDDHSCSHDQFSEKSLKTDAQEYILNQKGWSGLQIEVVPSSLEFCSRAGQVINRVVG
jgi:hypothetical protein